MKFNRKLWFKNLLSEIEIKLQKYNNISICTGKLKEAELSKLQSLYDVEKRFFGYTQFTKKLKQ